METIDYVTLNRESWNKRTDYHLTSEFYDNENFKKGANSLTEIELPLLGNLQGKTVLHLQCHFGQDTLSLARLGAKVTGVDLSDNAIKNARKLAAELNLEAEFICCNLYDLPQHLSQQFDVVFTSYGTVIWLPDLDSWAKIISKFLKPGGKFVFAEFHPVVWMYDNDFSRIEYSYFKTEPIIEEETGTYADKAAPITQTCVTWNHSLSEVLNSLLQNGLELILLNEYNFAPYNCLNHLEQVAEKRFQIKHFGDKVPLVYALVATKK